MEWETPPPAKRGRTSPKWKTIADQLRANPDNWAKIGTIKFPSQAAVIAKTHGIKVVTRKNESATFDLWAIYESDSN